MGDPAGIGAEVTARALDDDWVYQKCKPFVVGSTSAMGEALGMIDSSASARTAHSIEEVEGRPGAIDVLDLENLDFGAIEYGKVSPAAGKASVGYKPGTLVTDRPGTWVTHWVKMGGIPLGGACVALESDEPRRGTNTIH